MNICLGNLGGIVDLSPFQFERRMNALVVLRHYLNSSLNSVSIILLFHVTKYYLLIILNSGINYILKYI